MKYTCLVLSVAMIFLTSSGTAFAATSVRQGIVIKNYSVTSPNCAESLGQLRLMGLKEMTARRDKALSQAKNLPTDKARKEAAKKAQAAFALEMKRAAQQYEIAKAICKKPAPKK